jgi:hypothetical protein
MIRNQHPVRRQYPMRSRYLIVAATILALCMGVSSAVAQPTDNGPSVKPPVTANVYVPPADQFASPAAPNWPTNPQLLPRTASVNTRGDGSPWLAIGLAAGGLVVLCGCGVGIQRTRRKRPVA